MTSDEMIEKILLGRYELYLAPHMVKFTLCYKNNQYHISELTPSVTDHGVAVPNLKKFLERECFLYGLWMEFKHHPQSIVLDYLSNFYITRDLTGRVYSSFLVKDYYKEVFVEEKVDDDILVNP